MNLILIVVQIVASIALIGLILMQQGKGADAGASFGAGASQTFFGSAGSTNAITKLTALFAAIFFIASLSLAYVAQEEDRVGLQKELTKSLSTGSKSVSPDDELTPKKSPASSEKVNVKTPTGEAVNNDLAPKKAKPMESDSGSAPQVDKGQSEIDPVSKKPVVSE